MGGKGDAQEKIDDSVEEPPAKVAKTGRTSRGRKSAAAAKAAAVPQEVATHKLMFDETTTIDIVFDGKNMKLSYSTPYLISIASDHGKEELKDIPLRRMATALDAEDMKSKASATSSSSSLLPFASK